MFSLPAMSKFLSPKFHVPCQSERFFDRLRISGIHRVRPGRATGRIRPVCPSSRINFVRHVMYRCSSISRLPLIVLG